jgi:hypothetical protein
VQICPQKQSPGELMPGIFSEGSDVSRVETLRRLRPTEGAERTKSFEQPAAELGLTEPDQGTAPPSAGGYLALLEDDALLPPTTPDQDPAFGQQRPQGVRVDRPDRLLL